MAAEDIYRLVEVNRYDYQVWKQVEGYVSFNYDGSPHDKFFLRGKQEARGAEVGDHATMELRKGKMYAVLIKKEAP